MDFEQRLSTVEKQANTLEERTTFLEKENEITKKRLDDVENTIEVLKVEIAKRSITQMRFHTKGAYEKEYANETKRLQRELNNLKSRRNVM